MDQEKHVKVKEWPVWPVWQENANKYLKEVISSNRWSIRGCWTGYDSKEVVFAKKFANFHQCPYCVLTTSGSMALYIAMEALDISYGDEVIVPGMTWIAPVTAVLNVGAVPVMVDVEENTTCMDPKEIEDKITEKTKAILVVHLHCSVANMDEIVRIAKEHNLYIIEDCAEAHGAVWGDCKVGTLGDIGIFSFNQEKTLTCGEGGAVLTKNPEIYEKLFRTKTDGCALDEKRKILEDDQLIYDDHYMGSNFCMTEFQAAILLSQLEKLPEWLAKKQENAAYLDNSFFNMEGVRPLVQHDKARLCSYYEYGVRIDEDKFGGKSLDWIIEELKKESGICFHRTDIPVYRNELFTPHTKRKYYFYMHSQEPEKLKTRKFESCEYLYQHLIVFHHRYLLANKEDMDIIVDAFKKVQAKSKE